MKNNKKGFTLIELLVVISIIGVLASVVLASLNSARLKARDASAIASLVSMRTAAFVLVTNNGVYPSNIGNHTTGPYAAELTAVDNQVPGSATVFTGNPTGGGVGRWAAIAQLNDGRWYCVDSSGFAGYSGQSNAICVAGGGGS